MFPQREYRLTKEDIVELYLLEAVKAQLKRLDAMIKLTFMMNNIILGKIMEGRYPSVAKRTGAFSAVQAKITAQLPNLDTWHPVVWICENEVERTISTISKLASNDQAVSMYARRGMLDYFRNALVDIWIKADDHYKAKTVRTNISNMMDTLDNLPNLGYRVSYSRYLTNIGKRYHLLWTPGRRTIVSQNRALVPRTIKSFEERLLPFFERIRLSALR
jgi:hypothetical protein